MKTINVNTDQELYVDCPNEDCNASFLYIVPKTKCNDWDHHNVECPQCSNNISFDIYWRLEANFPHIEKYKQ